ncbi:hypothetical protein [Pseudomonas fluorescens]|uniref:hypothetical protein n=1 Tax=Pseudomonas fluorescens TaxID=294 RepID=UPI0012412AFB|nr:hypothetical protein [Pseudomonas fluorescens]
MKSTAPPKFINAPNISKAKKDLNDFNKAALRDQSGEITGFDMRFLRRAHLNTMQQHPEVALARKLLSNVSQKILELRGG